MATLSVLMSAATQTAERLDRFSLPDAGGHFEPVKIYAGGINDAAGRVGDLRSDAVAGD